MAKQQINPKQISSDWTDYTPVTVTGWSSIATAYYQYMIVGNTCFVRLHVDGTSNSGSIFISLPFTSADLSTQLTEVSTGLAFNNGAIDAAPARMYLSDTNTMRFVRLCGTASWTASGQKQVRIQFFYRIA